MSQTHADEHASGWDCCQEPWALSDLRLIYKPRCPQECTRDHDLSARHDPLQTAIRQAWQNDQPRSVERTTCTASLACAHRAESEPPAVALHTQQTYFGQPPAGHCSNMNSSCPSS